jgi:hypothetical protein
MQLMINSNSSCSSYLDSFTGNAATVTQTSLFNKLSFQSQTHLRVIIEVINYPQSITILIQ